VTKCTTALGTHSYHCCAALGTHSYHWTAATCYTQLLLNCCTWCTQLLLNWHTVTTELLPLATHSYYWTAALGAHSYHWSTHKHAHLRLNKVTFQPTHQISLDNEFALAVLVAGTDVAENQTCLSCACLRNQTDDSKQTFRTYHLNRRAHIA
jgi:hypothetical protein